MSQPTGNGKGAGSNANTGKKKGPILSGPTLLPGKKPAEKRPRQETPTKEQQGTDWQGRINEDMEWAKGQIGTAALGFKTNSVASLSQSVVEFLSVTLVTVFERQASTLSDMCGEIYASRDTNGKLTKELEDVKEELAQAKLGRNKVEAKASKKDMEDKVKLSATQFKVTDLDFGGAFTDRKELYDAGKKALLAKVRSDLRTNYEDKIKNASFKILSSKAFKRQNDSGEFWTAPVLVTIEDRDTRWQVEDILRSSKVFPGFHWPREMVDPVKAYRQAVIEMGFDEQDYYIRIRPEQRDGSWCIRADAKSKENGGKFQSIASFELPPLDASMRKTCDAWTKPVWISRHVNRDETDEDAFTQEDIIMHM
jgi:hypothetical protein